MDSNGTSSVAAGPEQILRMFQLTDDQLRIIKTQLLRQFEIGLADEDSASVKMLMTYVRELSRGDETGSYLALDLGGTHFRVLLVELNQGRAKVTSVVHDIPEELLTTSQGQDLFDYIALKLLEFVQANKLKRRRISLGFTFSFPCKQYGLTQSVLVKWCKGFRVGGVVGTDVVRQLKDALKRQLAGLVEAYIDVVAVINDTTGTLVACANTRPECRIGLIVGTGFNACYMERLDRCEKWPANYTQPKQVIVNCEWGALGDRKELDPFRNQFDVEIDAASVNPLNQAYEKMVSGMYIGELLRLAMLRLTKSRHLFASAAPEVLERLISGKLSTKNLLNGLHLSMLGKDEIAIATNGISNLSPQTKKQSYEETRKIFQKLGLSPSSYNEQDLRLIVQLGGAIMHRSAHLVAAGISALLQRLQRPFTVIGYDGSVIKHHPYFLRELINKCGQLTPAEFRFEFVMSSDGSGIGAAVVAAALHKERRPIYVVKPGKVYEMHYTRGQTKSTLSFDDVVINNNQNNTIKNKQSNQR